MLTITWILILEAVVIVTGNIITIVIFTTTPRLRSRQNSLIVNLAVGDLCVGMVSAPLMAVKQELGKISIRQRHMPPGPLPLPILGNLIKVLRWIGHGKESASRAYQE
ncbi:hypothetical protein AC249_AIPGENE3881 [Exaiptasia diaphana]|nr:hypothetical protein AC249_AIPGENE3881 [Exaiptasia diaphana]